MQLLQNGLQQQSEAAPLCSMRTRFLASSQSCRSTDVDDWCKRALKCCRNTMVDRILTWMITLILVCTSFIGYLHYPPDLRKYRWPEWRSTLPLVSSLSAATLSKSVHNTYSNVSSLFHVLPYAANLFLPTTRESNVFTGVCLCTEGTPSGQRLQWTETSRYWHLVGATGSGRYASYWSAFMSSISLWLVRRWKWTYKVAEIEYQKIKRTSKVVRTFGSYLKFIFRHFPQFFWKNNWMNKGLINFYRSKPTEVWFIWSVSTVNCSQILLTKIFWNLKKKKKKERNIMSHESKASKGDACTGFPLFRADKIPWYFHDFSRFFSKFPGIIFIIFKVWFLSGFEYEYAKLLSFIWIKN